MPERAQPSARTLELRHLVARLEFAKHEAMDRRDMEEANRIDRQIADAGREWAASFAADHEQRFRKTA